MYFVKIMNAATLKLRTVVTLITLISIIMNLNVKLLLYSYVYVHTLTYTSHGGVLVGLAHGLVM